MRSAAYRATALLVLCLALALAGCATAPPKTEPEPAPKPPSKPALLVEAERARAQDQPTLAAYLYARAAEELSGSERAEALLNAAELRLELDQLDQARSAAERVDAQSLDTEGRQRLTLVRAELAIIDEDYRGAWDQLRDRPSGLAPRQQRRWLQLQAQALEGLERFLEAARRRNQWFDHAPENDTAAIDRNRQALWQDLTRVPLEQLQALMPPAPDRFGAWLELAYLFHSYRLDLQRLTQEVDDWRDRYPEHPANDYARTLLSEHRERLQPPERIALLLPLSGRLAPIGDAIKHGFMAAYYAASPPRPRLRVFDIGEDGQDALSAYRDAVEGGVDLVVGPLTKASLEMLSVWDNFPVPVLALNQVEGSPLAPERFYQFGLAPEDDARAAAELMAGLGHRRAVVLVPNSNWGDRVAGAFTERFEDQAGNGEVLEQAAYADDASDFAAPLQQLFNLDASRKRYAQLRRTLSAEVEFEPRRRQDMDGVFFAAYPRQARLIRPQIRFHHGIDLPVFATSHAWGGTPEPDANQDMDGLKFVDIPWLLGGVADLPEALAHDRLNEVWPTDLRHFPRLVALGIDAYRLAPIVDVLREYPSGAVPAATGRIRVRADGQLERDLMPAEFVDGRVRPLPPPKADGQ